MLEKNIKKKIHPLAVFISIDETLCIHIFCTYSIQYKIVIYIYMLQYRIYFYSKPTAFRERTLCTQPSPACFHRSSARLVSHLLATSWSHVMYARKESTASLQDIDSHPHFASIPASSVPAIAHKQSIIISNVLQWQTKINSRSWSSKL